MKKAFILFTFLIIVSVTGKAQYYSFSQATETYYDLTTPTVISTPGWDYYVTYTIPLPFSFRFFNTPFDTFYLAGGFGGFVYYGQNVFGGYQMYFYEASLIDRQLGASTISYEVTGTAPNRIFIVQVADAGFEDDINENDFINVQVWFYEGTDVLEFHYGPESVVNPNSWDFSNCLGPYVAIGKDSTSFVQLMGSSSNPTASTTVIVDCITGAPPVDKVYRFTPFTSSIFDPAENSVLVYPNPSSGKFYVSGSFIGFDYKLTILDVTGKLVYRKEFSNTDAVEIEAPLSPGIYLLKVNSNAGQVVKKIIIK